MGAVVRITLKDLPDAVRKNVEASRRAIVRGTHVGAERSRGILVRRTPTDQGQLRASWKVRAAVQSLGGVVMDLASVENDAPHAGIVELGARPHGVSPEGWVAIYEWVRRHPELYTHAGSASDSSWQGPNRPKMRQNPRGRDNNGKYTPGSVGDRPFHGPDPEITAITNAITGKLRREGQKPTYFVRNSVQDCARATSQEIGREFERTANELARAGSV